MNETTVLIDADEVQQKIEGYRASTKEISLINEVKVFANDCEKFLLELENRGIEIDKRWMAIGKTELQKGFMAVVRAIAKPTGF